MSSIAPLVGIVGFDLSHGINPSHGHEHTYLVYRI
jgi:hypothetical protein